MDSHKLSRILAWIKREIIQVIPAVIYFAIAFNLIYFTVGLRLGPEEVRYFTPLTVTIDALIAGKILIIANSLPFINAFPNKPLIYNILWKFFIYSFVTFFLWTIETLARLIDKYEHMRTVLPHLIRELTSPVFWSTELCLSAVFFVFVVFSEFTRVLGKDKVMKILLG